MMQKITIKLFFLFLCMYTTIVFAQTPKLIVGIVIDQMRWDYLHRYAKQFKKEGGFNMLLNKGFSCDNTYIPYIPTVTACGHASIYSGTTPAIHGIVGNTWFDKKNKKQIISTDDDIHKQSPKNLMANTIGDQIRFSHNFKSKTFSVALKDRASILPGGHTCNAAFWWNDKIGNWQTSTYYTNVPEWFNKINYKTQVDNFYKKGWKSILPIDDYINSTSDNKQYEKGVIDKNISTFNYNLEKFVNTNYGAIKNIPYGIDITFNFAKDIIKKENLGNNPDNVPDMISISISSTDIIGHNYGINSIEMEDTYIRLDEQLGNFIQYLNKKIGENNYVLFLSADHGVSPIPEYLQENNLPSGRFNIDESIKKLDRELLASFKIQNIIDYNDNNQLYLNHNKIDSANLNYDAVVNFILNYYQNQKEILYVFECKNYINYPMHQQIKTQFGNGYYAPLSGDIQFILKPFFISGGNDKQGTTHGAWNSYDSHIPLLWLGNNIKSGHTHKKYFMTDIASTLAALLNIEQPSSSVGNVIEEIIK